MKRYLQAIAASLPLAFTAAAAHAGAVRSVTLDAATIRSGLIKTRTLRLKTEHAGIAAYGMVIDPAPVIALRSRIVAARAMLTLDDANLARARKLYHSGGNVSKASLQQTEADTAVVQARLKELLAQAKVRYGTALGTAIADDGAPFRTIEGGRSLVSVVHTSVALDTPPSAWAKAPDGSRVALCPVGSASRIPKGLLGQAFFYTGPALAIGSPLAVTLATSKSFTGYDVPATALVWHDNTPFVFVRATSRRFAMYPIATANPVRHAGTVTGFFVPGADLPDRPRVVTSGAGLLSSAVARGAETSTNDD